MSLGAINGIATSKLRLTVRGWGAWWVDADIVDPEEFAKGSAATVTIGGSTLSGAVVSGGAHAGRASYHIVGGRGRWGAVIPRKPYRDDAGIKISKLLTDAAREAGETLGPLPTTRIGQHYARREGPASRLLGLLTPTKEGGAPEWFIDYAGVTQIGKRPTTTYAGDAARVRVDKKIGVIDLAVESLEGLLPGVIVDGMPPATDVEFELTASRLTARVYGGPSALTKRFRAYRTIFNSLFPQLPYLATREYRVVDQSDERLDLQPVRTGGGWPALDGVPVRGPSGFKVKHLPGSLVIVTFLEGDPSRPMVTGGDAPDAPGWMPLEIQLGDDPALGIARVGDTVLAGPYAGVITGSSARIKAGL